MNGIKPHSYATVFQDPNMRIALYWLSELVWGDFDHTFETRFGAPFEAKINRNIDRNYFGGIHAISSEHWEIKVTPRMGDKVLLSYPNARGPWLDTLNAICKVMGMPPACGHYDVVLALTSMSNALDLRNSIAKDCANRGVPVSDEQISDMVREVERLATSHSVECEHLCNVGSEDSYDRIEQIEKDLAAHIAAFNAVTGGQGLSYTTQRDPRGAPIRLTFTEQAHDSTVALHHLEKTFYMVRNPLAFGNQAPTAIEREAARHPVKKEKSAKVAPIDIKETAVDEDVLMILRQGTWSPKGLFLLPEGQMERRLYERVANFIKLANGRWKTSSGGFCFKEGPEKFTRLLATGEVLDKKAFDFFPTPQSLAKELVEASGLRPGMLVLEPSAGDGAIADAAATIVGKGSVYCRELLGENCKLLRDKGYQVTEGDFLASEPVPMYDRVLMNPPFANMNDIRHIQHAVKFLKPDGELVSIMAPGHQYRNDELSTNFRALLLQAGDTLRDIEAGAFSESGTEVPTVMVSLRAADMPASYRALPTVAPDEDQVDEHETMAQQRMQF